MAPWWSPCGRSFLLEEANASFLLERLLQSNPKQLYGFHEGCLKMIRGWAPCCSKISGLILSGICSDMDLRTHTNKACVYERLDYALNFVNCPRFNMIGTWDDLYDHLRRMRTFIRYLYNFHKRLQSWFGLLIISLKENGCIVSFSAHLPYVRNKFAKTKTRSTCRAHDTY